MAFEVKHHLYRFKNENKIRIFDKIIAYQAILCEKLHDGEYIFKVLLK